MPRRKVKLVNGKLRILQKSEDRLKNSEISKCWLWTQQEYYDDWERYQKVHFKIGEPTKGRKVCNSLLIDNCYMHP